MIRKRWAALLVVVLILASAAIYIGVTRNVPGEGKSTCNVTTNVCTASSNTSFITTTVSNTTNKVGRPVYIAFAYAPGCPHCEALNSFILNMSRTYDIRTLYINAITNQTLLSEYLNHYNVPQSDWGSVPILFVNGTYTVGDTVSMSYLSAHIAEFAQEGVSLPPVSGATLGTLSVLEVTGLALVDSINPCAFAVLIFFLSTLFMWDPTRKYRLLLGGASFALGIFAFYFVVGVGLLLGIRSVLAVTGLQNVYIYGAFGVFAIALGVLNLKDYFSYGSLGFVMEVPRRLRPRMLGTMDRIMLSNVAYIPAAFVTGVLVTAFLLPCISGPYFVAGSLLKDLQIGTALLWLAYYNFLFVLPMLIITLLVYLSLTSVEKASGFRERNIRRLHLVAGVLLILVGVIMLSSFLV
jgi:thiol-disulfide isomerase/thioredoxin